ncbi:TPA: hypothetical protein R9Z04_002228 [Bacillus cereus]|nr:hypothetical protein [Bacillus cereus]
MDRYKGWKYSESGEPILPSTDGFSDFLDEHVREYKFLTKDKLLNELKILFSKGHRAAVDIWLEHTDGTPYTTAILLEGIDDADTVYYTKINVTINRTYVEMDFNYLKDCLSLDVNEEARLTIIKHSDKLDLLEAMNPLEAFHYIFSNLYGYKFEGEDLYRNEKKIQYDLSGFDKLIAYLESSMDEIVTESGIPKHHEIRLSRHIENKLTPIQSCLHYILNTEELRIKLSKELIKEIENNIDQLNQRLKSVLKFASLLIQRPQASFYQMYLKSVKDLREYLPIYQQAHNNVIFSLASN